MTKKQKLGVALIVSPFVLLFTAFLITFLLRIFFPGGNIILLIPFIMGILGIIGVILSPILITVGIILIVRNKEEKPPIEKVVNQTPEVVQQKPNPYLPPLPDIDYETPPNTQEVPANQPQQVP